MERATAAGSAPPEKTGRDEADVLTVVIGGGITGLTVAYRLHLSGHRVLVLESRPDFGGVIRTKRDDGWLFEDGPNTVLSQPEMDRLVADLGLASERLDASTAAARRYVVRNGRLIPLPANPAAFLATSLFSLAAKLRILREPFIPPFRGGEETVADFTRRRLGTEFLDYAVGPFVSGVYAGDPEKLSVRHAVRKVHALEARHGSLIRGAMAMRKATKGVTAAPRGTILSFRDGLATLPGTMARKLGDAARAGVRVDSIRADGAGFEIRYTAGEDGARSISAGRVVVALDSIETASVLETLDPDGRLRLRRIADIPYAGVAVGAMGYARSAVAHPLDGFGLLVPKREGLGILGSLFTSTLFPGRAPEGHVALTTIAGGATDPGAVDLDDRELARRMSAALQKLLGVTGPPVHLEITRWKRAIPQYNLGHQEFLDIADQVEERHPGLHLAGNWRQGVSVGDCMTNAAALAARISNGIRAAEPA